MKNASFSLSSSPVIHDLIIESTTDWETFFIYNVLNQPVLSGSDAGGLNTVIQLHSLTSGMYSIVLKASDNHFSTKRFIKVD